MTKKLLLVEDNSDDELMILETLEKHGFKDQIAIVRDGAAALDYLFARGAYAERGSEDLPQAILLDLRLPKVSGLEVLKQIRASEGTRCIPVVVFTSSSEERDLVESYQLGANSYVRKPVRSAEFARAVQYLGVYWKELNETVVTCNSRKIS